jgi:hypothetical protein
LEEKYAGMTVSDPRRLKILGAESRLLKQIVAEQAMDNWTLKELLSKTANLVSKDNDARIIIEDN